MLNPIATLLYTTQVKYERGLKLIHDCKNLKGEDFTAFKVAIIAKRGFFILVDYVSGIVFVAVFLGKSQKSPLGKHLKTIRLIALSCQVLISSAFVIQAYIDNRTAQILEKNEEIQLYNRFINVYNDYIKWNPFSFKDMPSKEQIDERNSKRVATIKEQLLPREKQKSKILMIQSIAYAHLFNIAAVCTRYLLSSYLDIFKVTFNLGTAIRAFDHKKIDEAYLLAFIGANYITTSLSEKSQYNALMGKLIALATDTPEVTIY